MEIQVKVIQKLSTKEGVSASGKAWMSYSFIGETIETYPRKVCFDVFGEKRIQENPISIDGVYNVSFDLESREFNGRWYTSVNAWKITPVTHDASQQSNIAAEIPSQGYETAAPTQANYQQQQYPLDDNGLPF